MKISAAIFCFILVLLANVSLLEGGDSQPDTNLAAKAVFDFYDSYSTPRALDLASEYKSNLQHGRFEEAEYTFDLISSLFADDAERERFWEKIIPDGGWKVLLLCQICPDCNDGHCRACGGSGACPSCQGLKCCPECKGKGFFSKPCTACLCRHCKATGICPACDGCKTLQCPVCRGTGMGKQEFKKKNCPRCGGSGQITHLGLKSTCPVCKGSGSISSYSTPQCPRCGGKGRINCPECGGTGKCRVCGGRGRMAECAQCGGKGYLVTTCAVCQGTGKCLCCQNTGICPVCKGSGVCPRCAKAGIILCHRLQVPSDWLRVPPEVILHRETPAPTNGFFQCATNLNITAGRHELNLNVQSNEVLCISEIEDFEWVKRDVLR